MSWDFSFVMPCCGTECANAGNLTFNLSKMMTAANVHPDILKGKTGKEIIPILRKAWSELIKDPDKFKRYNPPNGWGSYEGLLTWLKETVETAEEHLDAKFAVGGEWMK
jgi:hypothetical protein